MEQSMTAEGKTNNKPNRHNNDYSRYRTGI